MKSAPARVVTVASVGHRRGTLDFDDLGFERGYWIMKAYAARSWPTCCSRPSSRGVWPAPGVTSNSLHPGAVATNIWSGAPLWAKPIIRSCSGRSSSAPRGAARYIVQLAASPDLEGVTGKYFEEGQRVDPAPLARDQALARRLWDKSSAMAGL